MPRNTSGLLGNIELDIGGNSSELVILLHGMGGRLDDCHAATRAALPDADIWAPTYLATPLSDVNPYDVAVQISSWIEKLVNERKNRNEQPGAYKGIYLVGFSGGGAILRRAYLIGKGMGDKQNSLSPALEEWPSIVDRIVLLAGINRGISDIKPAQMHTLKYLAIRSGLALLRVFEILRLDSGRFVSSLRRGSSFITNLRLDWIQASRDGNVPVLIQLLGDRDDIVAMEDNIDVLSDSKAVYIQVFNSTHESIATFPLDTNYGKERRQKFIDALTADKPVGDLMPREIQPEQKQAGEETTDFVFVLHGIRDRGEWTSKVKDEIVKTCKNNGRKVEVNNESYGYFPMVRFLLFVARQTNVRWFADQFVEAISRYPGARVSFVGHSNGTYVLAAALKRYSALKFKNVYFAGSVLPTNFEWGKYFNNGQVEAIRNDTATRDLVVGWFPGFYEFIGSFFAGSDLGSAGFNGFMAKQARRTPYRFKGGHGAAIQEINHRSIANFIVHGDDAVPPPSEALLDKPNGFVEFFSKNCWFVWGFILVVLWALGAKIVVPLLISYGIPSIAGGAMYVLFVLLLMYCL